MSYIKQIRERFKKSEIRPGSAPAHNVSDLPLDHQLSFIRGNNEKWSFQEGKICLNNEDIDSILDASRNDIRLQSAVTDAISEYKECVRLKGSGHYESFAMCAEGVLDKILCNMKRIYDEKTGGVQLRWGDGGYLLNNLNVRALLAMYHVRPTEKAKRFLGGLKSKLALILVNRNGNPQFDHMNKMVKQLYAEVDDALNTAPIDAHRLPAHCGNNNA